MKFGKQLSRIIGDSDSEWAAFWVSYKALKKSLKALPRGKYPPAHVTEGTDTEAKSPGRTAVSVPEVRDEEQTTQEQEDDNSYASSKLATALSRSAEEVTFFRLLYREVRKAHDFFTSMMAQTVLRLSRLRGNMHVVDMDTILARDERSWRRLMSACLQLYKGLVRLEVYGFVTWMSFHKILKKHDKWTGYCTRERFMKNVINNLPFAQNLQLICMLEEVEAIYNRTQRISECSHLKDRDLVDEQLFLDTIRGIKRDCMRMDDYNGDARLSKRQQQPTEAERISLSGVQ